MSTITEIQNVETIQMKLPTVLNLKSGSAAAHSRRNKIKLDPLRALEPARKKLSTIEAQRVMAVLEETKRRCEVVAVMPYILKNLEEKFAALVGDPLAQQLTEHKRLYDTLIALESKHTDIVLQINQMETSEQGEPESGRETPQLAPTPPTSRPPSRNLSSRGSARLKKLMGKPAGPLSEQLDEVLSQVKSLELQLSLSMKNLLRSFSLNPGVVSMLTEEVGNNRSREGNYLTSQLGELREVLMGKLLMTPIEEREKMQYLAQVWIFTEKSADCGT